MSKFIGTGLIKRSSYPKTMLVAEGVAEPKHQVERRLLSYNTGKPQIDVILNHENWVYVYLKPGTVVSGQTYIVDGIDTQMVVMCAPLSSNWTLDGEPWGQAQLNAYLTGAIRASIVNIKLSPYPPFSQADFATLEMNDDETVNVGSQESLTRLPIILSTSGNTISISGSGGGGQSVAPSINSVSLWFDPNNDIWNTRIDYQFTAILAGVGGIASETFHRIRNVPFSNLPDTSHTTLTFSEAVNFNGTLTVTLNNINLTNMILSNGNWIDVHGNNIATYTSANEGIIWDRVGDVLNTIVRDSDKLNLVALDGVANVITSLRNFSFATNLTRAENKINGYEFEEIRLVDHLGDYMAFDPLRIGENSTVLVYDELTPTETSTILTLETGGEFYRFNSVNYNAIVQKTDTGLPIYISAMDEFFATNKNWLGRNELERETARQMQQEQERARWLGLAGSGVGGLAGGSIKGALMSASIGAIGVGLSNASGRRSLAIQETKSLQMEAYSIGDMQYAPPTMNGNANILINRRVAGLLPHLDIYRVEPHVLDRWQRYFEQYGFKVNMLGDIEIKEGYIEAEIIQFPEDCNIPEASRARIKQRFSEGIRFVKPYDNVVGG